MQIPINKCITKHTKHALLSNPEPVVFSKMQNMNTNWIKIVEKSFLLSNDELLFIIIINFLLLFVVVLLVCFPYAIPFSEVTARISKNLTRSLCSHSSVIMVRSKKECRSLNLVLITSNYHTQPYMWSEEILKTCTEHLTHTELIVISMQYHMVPVIVNYLKNSHVFTSYPHSVHISYCGPFFFF